jgi:uncharacterized protein (TIGR00296 family)
VFQLAQAVADSDPRFDKVTVAELPEIGFEISVLTREREVTSVDEIEVGRHGLIVERGSSRGLLLPQVPVEHGWDRDTFLDHACLKPDSTPTPGAAVRACSSSKRRCSANVRMDNVCHTLVGPRAAPPASTVGPGSAPQP